MKDIEKPSRRERIKTSSINGIISALLALVLLYILTPIFHLSGVLRYTVMIVLCIVSSIVVSLKPKWVLATVCFLVLLIGVALVFLSTDEEIASEITWNPSLLGAGASIIAIAIAFYTLIHQMQEARELAGSDRNISDSQRGYVWLEKIEKYRCEHCLCSGKYHYCKTLKGIERHIAKAHR